MEVAYVMTHGSEIPVRLETQQTGCAVKYNLRQLYRHVLPVDKYIIVLHSCQVSSPAPSHPLLPLDDPSFTRPYNQPIYPFNYTARLTTSSSPKCPLQSLAARPEFGNLMFLGPYSPNVAYGT